MYVRKKKNKSRLFPLHMCLLYYSYVGMYVHTRYVDFSNFVLCLLHLVPLTSNDISISVFFLLVLECSSPACRLLLLQFRHLLHRGTSFLLPILECLELQTESLIFSQPLHVLEERSGRDGSAERSQDGVGSSASEADAARAVECGSGRDQGGTGGRGVATTLL